MDSRHEYDTKNESALAFRNTVRQDVQNRSRWVSKQQEIMKRMRGARPKIKKSPYRGAPNFVEPVIDDTVREKVDQEISMLFNSPALFHVLPMMDIDTKVQNLLQHALDSYWRHIIKARPRLENGMWDKNCKGFAIFQQVRRYNRLLQQELPDFDWCSVFDIIFPIDTKVSEFSDSEYIVRVHRVTVDQFRRMGKAGKWKNVKEVIALAAGKGDRDASSSDADEDELETVADQVGITTNGSEKEYILLWECYRLASKHDVSSEAEGDYMKISAGDRIRQWVCPDYLDHPLHTVPWREPDEVEIEVVPEPLVDEDGNEQFGLDGEPLMIPAEKARVVKGDDRHWGFVICPYENVSDYVMQIRGGGEICMDDQIEATQQKNNKMVYIDYLGKPLLKTALGGYENSGNISFEPGSTLPMGMDVVNPPTIPPQFDYSMAQARSNSAKRMGTGALAMNPVTVSPQGQSTKPKSAAEVNANMASQTQVSSASVERFNEPISEVAMLIWQDMKRMRLKFPVLGGNYTGVFQDQLYDLNIIITAASSAKTLNPQVQLGASMNLARFVLEAAQMVPVDPTSIIESVLGNYDPMMTQGWIVDPEAGPIPMHQQILQAMEDIKALAAGGKGLQTALTDVQKLSLENSEKLNAQTTEAPNTPGY